MPVAYYRCVCEWVMRTDYAALNWAFSSQQEKSSGMREFLFIEMRKTLFAYEQWRNSNLPNYQTAVGGLRTICSLYFISLNNRRHFYKQIEGLLWISTARTAAQADKTGSRFGQRVTQYKKLIYYCAWFLFSTSSARRAVTFYTSFGWLFFAFYTSPGKIIAGFLNVLFS